MHYFQITNTETLLASGAVFGPRSQGGLGRRLVAQILLLNMFLSVFASAVQLYAGYQRDRAQILGVVDGIDQSLRSGFEGALWEYNFELVEALLEGVVNKADVANVVLSTPQGRVWEKGTATAALTFQPVEFRHVSSNGMTVPLGTMQVGLSTENAAARVRSQLWTLLLSNFAKTICASIALLALFNWSVGRHLKRIACLVSQTSWQQSDDVITLDRKQSDHPDDIDHIVHAIVSAKKRSRHDYQKLRKEVSQRRVVESLLRKRSTALENANKEQAQFTYAISHDLKSPANTISMLIGELKITEDQSLSEDGREILDDADRTIKRMMDLVEDVLDYARTVDGDMKVERFNLTELVTGISEDLQADIRAADAQIKALDLPVVQGNPVQLRMLFQNLIANAIKFRAPDTPPKIEIKGTTNAEGDVVITVADNGIGIEQKFQSRVFGLFQRLHSHGEYAGSGLGLTLCKRIVFNHNGDIALTSEPGMGCRFTISLPGGDYGSDA